ncbi:small multi-drug export protein [Arcobacter sp. LA11]|uniref:small multi-drug export protein n=1 Tax=Arcobacter sp. LA11 TaxID=1898176 RepID=UPI0009329AE3|nr:small multi-drug export protein [Arcobacter sp. LA11]
MPKLLQKLYKGEEGNILILSLCITFSLLVFIIISYQVDVAFANRITGIVFTNLLVGRVPALSFGYAADLSHFVVIFTNITTEMILVTAIYPLFIFSFKGVLKIKVLEEFFTEVQMKKNEHQEKFDKYGRFGLFVFVFIPFWMTGPIVGSIIGFLIGMKHYVVIFIVFIATIISITLWGLFLQEIIDFLLIFDTQIVWVLLLFVVSVLLFLRFRKKIFGNRNEKE